MRQRSSAFAIIVLSLSFGILTPGAMSQNFEQQALIDQKTLVDQILTVEARQRAMLEDIIFDAEFVESEKNDQGELVVETRLIKKVYLKYLPDTVWFFQEYLEYYKEGELQSAEDCAKDGADREEKKAKRKSMDISYPMLRAFEPANSDDYDVTYEGIPDDKVGGYTCHHFRVRVIEAHESLMNGNYFFDTESFHLVRVDFAPSKLVKKLMFKIKRLQMSLNYAPTAEGIWLPTRFDIEGTGKTAFFFGMKFAGTEYYANPQINSGINDSLFEVSDD